MVISQLILDELRSFYQNLYRNQDYQDIDDIYADFFNNTTLPKVMEDTKLKVYCLLKNVTMLCKRFLTASHLEMMG